MSGVELSAEEYARLASDVTAAEGEVARLTGLLEQAQERRTPKGADSATPSSDTPSGSAESSPNDRPTTA